MNRTHGSSITRRMIIRAAAIGAAAGVLTGATTAQNDTNEIELGGQTSAWIGVSPEEIEDERNPTLELVEGEEYTLVWENIDGAGHNFIIEDEEGEERFVETEIISGTGTTQDVEFTAEEGMAEYFCGPHPQSMRGEIAFADDEPEEEEEEEEEPIDEFAAAVDELYTFSLDDEGWRVVEPAELAEEGETNPTIELEAGGTYVFNWINELEDEAVDVDEDEDDAVEDEGADEDENDVDEDENDVDEDENDVDEDENDVDEDETENDELTTELVVLAADDQEFVRSNETPVGESSAVAFVATGGLERYRDELTGSEGEIEVEGDDVDENGPEDTFLDPPDDEEEEDDDDGEDGEND